MLTAFVPAFERVGLPKATILDGRAMSGTPTDDDFRLRASTKEIGSRLAEAFLISSHGERFASLYSSLGCAMT